MCKKFLGLAVALVMLFGVVAIAKAQMDAVKFKFGGYYRIRGVATDNRDRNDDNDDNEAWLDSVFRPRLTATMADKARMFVELDIPVWNAVGGNGSPHWGGGYCCGPAAGNGFRTPETVNATVYNLQIQVPGMPGWFVRGGRDNGFSPRGQIGMVPQLRDYSIQVWGSVPGMMGLKPRFEAWKLLENELAHSDDSDLYVLKLPFSMMKGIRVMPYLSVLRDESSDMTRELTWPAVQISTRQGNFFGKLDFIYQTGEYNNTDVRAHLIWVEVGGSWGPFTASVNYVNASGDNDAGDDEISLFFGVPGKTRTQGPTNLWFGEKYADTSNVSGDGSADLAAGGVTVGGLGRNIGGAGGSSGNGTSTISVDAAYVLTKALKLHGTVGFISSAEADLRADRVSDKFIGTEIDVGAVWSIYKGIALHGNFGYLSAGEYGEPADGSEKNDDSWLAVWRLQWFF